VFMFGHREDSRLGLHPRHRPYLWLNMRYWSWAEAVNQDQGQAQDHSQAHGGGHGHSDGDGGTQYEYRDFRRGVRMSAAASVLQKDPDGSAYTLPATPAEQQREQTKRMGELRLRQMGMAGASEAQIAATEAVTGYKKMIPLKERLA